MTAEEVRPAQGRDRTAYWKRWGPYLSERQWERCGEDQRSPTLVGLAHRRQGHFETALETRSAESHFPVAASLKYSPA